REDETRDKNVPQTRRQECLRYIKVGTALDTAALRFLAAIAAPSPSVVKKQAGVGTFVFPKRDTATDPKAMADAQARR
ncbi:MAG: hypothetical protein ABSG80_16670, partial [Verrucomicrobiota bacterium]